MSMVENLTAVLYNSTAMLHNSTVTTPEDGGGQHRNRECRYLVTFTVYTVVAGTICFLGFVGNIVSFFVLRKDRESPVASFQLQWLAITDNFFIVMWFIQISLPSAFDYFGYIQLKSAFWIYLRTYTHPPMYMGQMATIGMTVLIATSRYIAICKPYKASVLVTVPRMKVGVALVAVFSILYNVPRFFESYIDSRYHDGLNTTLYIPRRTSLMHNQVYTWVYTNVLYYIFSFVLPLLLLVVLNTKLLLAYKVIQRRRMTMRSRHDHRENNITLVMIIVVLIFMLCNAPARIVQIIWAYSIDNCPRASYMITVFSNVLEVFNSSTNFIVYCVFRKKFRDILKEQVLCRKRAESPDHDTTKIYLTSTNGNHLANGDCDV